MNKYLDLLGFDYYHRNIKKRIDLKNIFIKYWGDKTPEEILADMDNPPKEGDYFFKTGTNTLYQFQKELSGELIRLIANPVNPIPQNSLYIRNDDNRLFKWDGELMKYMTAYPDVIEVSKDSDYDILPTIVLKETKSQIKIRKNLKVDLKYNKTDAQKTRVHYSPEQIYFLAGKDNRKEVDLELSVDDIISEPGSQIHLTKDKVDLIGHDKVSTYSGSAYFNTKNNLDLNSNESSIHLFGEHNVEISTGSEYTENGAVVNRIRLGSPNIDLMADLLEVNATKTYLLGNTLETSTHRTYLDSKLFEVGSNKTYLQAKDLCEISASKIYCQALDVFEVSAYETYALSGLLEVSAEDTYFRTKFLEIGAEESYMNFGNLEVSSRSGYINFEDKLETSAQNTYIRVKDLNEIHSQNTKIRAREDVDLIARNIILEGLFNGNEKPLKLEIKNFDEVSFGAKYITSPTKDLLFKPSPDELAIPIIQTLIEAKEVASAALNDLHKNLIEDERVTSEALNDLNNRIIEINNKIPSQASSSNQLADKDYVNSSIATSTATFRGVYNSVEELQNAETDADLNDYAYVKLTDATGNTLYDRYKWGSRGWMYEYTLNNSNFTAKQWAAINSGITTEKVGWLNSLIVDVAKVSSYTVDGDRVYIYNGEPVKYGTFTESAEESGTSHNYHHMVFMGPYKIIKDFSRDVDSGSDDPFTLEATYSWDDAPLKIKNLFNCSQIVDISNANSIVFNEDDYIYLWDGKPLECKTYTDSEYSHVVFKDLNGRYKDFSLDTDSASDDPYTLDNTYIVNAPLLIKQLFDKGPINTTYSELLALKNSEKLIAGTSYRITDYVTTTVLEDTKSANHAFDIIVTAIDNKTLNENAKAILQEYSPETGEHDTYFDECKLSAWELKYCIDNDINRFAWADETNGKGVIYYMKDEYNNECPYDFKNILFKRYGISNIDNSKINPTLLNSLLFIFKYSNGESQYFATKNNTGDWPRYIQVLDEDKYEWFYTFNGIYSEDGTLITDPNCYFYDLTVNPFKLPLDEIAEEIEEEGLDIDTQDVCRDNVIKEATLEDYKFIMETRRQVLNNIVLNVGVSYCYHVDNPSKWYYKTCTCIGNYFDVECRRITTGTTLFYNKFKKGCINLTLGNSCYYNTFGNVASLFIMSGCEHNTFEGNNVGNILLSVRGNVFNKGCAGNILSPGCDYNTFGTYCFYNVLNNSCSLNIFGNFVHGIEFSKPYTVRNVVESGNRYIKLTSTASPDFSDPLTNITIALGTNTIDTLKTISHNTTGDTFKTTYLNPNSVIVNV